MLPFIILLAGLAMAVVFPSAMNTQGSNLLVPQFRAALSPPKFPRFDRVLLLETTSETSANVGIGDLNGDGHLDILLVKGRHWPLQSRVLLGDGRGRFPTAYNLGDLPYRSYSGRLVDIDADGDLDVVLSNDAPDPKVVYMNDGKGHFHVGSTYGRPEWETRNASVADLNGDGRPDIIVANRTDKNPANYICLNQGKGHFDSNCVAFSHESATTITPADFNHDRLIDFAVPNRDGGQSYVYVGGAGASYSNLRRVPFGPADATIRMAEAADLNGDGLLDIVAIDERRGVAIYYGQKDRTFSAGTALDGGGARPYALALRDLNGDGRIDIVVGNVEAPSTIYFNDSNGSRSDLIGGHFTPVHFGDNKGTVYGFAIADLDSDGLPDIAVARSDAPNAIYFASTGPAGTP
ncbi:MAG TPA: VCBS repeat-containing protein [Pyrinomonadaceae bacterium]|nr:VCBS repeat-containing protein [Pyrinomonadaceae bacterium]